ncbi:guanine nucleotide exchange factor DBS isoform X5 [Octopus sinensis]|uniref:Guanine nucleotide exchange factor DBS isoform X5 n=1 Tax=Octopus sinensis TaxID=2607531 RepID=A0A7E6FCT0_9MOLL|nr:guanine nucleotide exchange factor DBS isoform X5 [Octopus sinensis]
MSRGRYRQDRGVPSSASGSASGGFQAHKIEEEIENFVENFKRNNQSQPLDKDAVSLESGGESSGLQSSLCSTDEYTDDSPEEFPSHRYLLRAFAARNRKYSSTNTSTRTSVSPASSRSVDCGSESWIDQDAYGMLISDRVAPVPLPVPSYVMGEMDLDCSFTVLDVAEVLQSKYAFITGGKARNGAPILTFPDVPGIPEITDEQYKKVMIYLCTIPAKLRLYEVEKGFVIILDKRNDGWGTVKSILLKLSAFFPTHIQVVFLLQPHGFLQRALADFRSKFVKEELEFKVVMCNNQEELHEHIDPSQLTKDLGGEIEYDHKEWIEQRAASEKFSTNVSDITHSLDQLAARYEETEIPNDVTGTEALIREHIQGRKELLDDLNSTTNHGEILLNCVKGNSQEIPLVKLVHVVELERLLTKLEQNKLQFEMFWGRHENKLRQCLQLRQFEEEFKLIQYASERNLEFLESSMSNIGESSLQLDGLFGDFEEFEKKAKKNFETTDRLCRTGEQLIRDDHYAIDSIQPKYIELQRIRDRYKRMLKQRRDILYKARDLHDRIERANKWCNRGLDLLADQQIEKFHTQGGAEKAAYEIREFLHSAQNLNLSNPKEFRTLFEGIMNSDMKGIVQDLLKRKEEVKGMCEKRLGSLQKVTSNPMNPAQSTQPKMVKRSVSAGNPVRGGAKSSGSSRQLPNTSANVKVQPPPSSSSSSASSSYSSYSSRSSSSTLGSVCVASLSRDEYRCSAGQVERATAKSARTPASSSSSRLEMSVRNSSGLQKQHRRNHTQVQRSRSVMDVQAENQYSSRRSRSPHNPPHHSSSFDLADSDYSGHEKSRHSSSALRLNARRHSAIEPCESRLLHDSLLSHKPKCCFMTDYMHVYRELVETEKTYVSELYDILWGYYYEMDNKALQHLLPPVLRNNRDTLFGNLREIYAFHHNVFLDDLQSCRDTPAKVGLCFVNRSEEFQMYSIYCQNKPRSENLIDEIGDHHPYFKECQRRLGHKLPLGAYLLKPVQRITKYHLLLKEMLKYAENDPSCNGLLQDALDTILGVLKYVNDIMHQVSIVNFDGNIGDLGKLLMQGSFQVWTEHKNKIRDFRFKPMARHIFLYEKAVLLCKRKDDNQSSSNAVYIFKNMLKMSLVGLTESVKGDKKKFELWLRGREEVYIIQAPSIEVKDIWVKEIKNVLLNQFDQLRVHRLSHCRYGSRSQEDLTRMGRFSESMEGSSGDSWHTRSMSHSTGSAPTVPVGLEMNSPLESPPGDGIIDEGWSSGEFSNSDEDIDAIQHHRNFDRIEPSFLQRFSVLADYIPVDSSELTLQENDIVEILRIGAKGWWLARHLGSSDEGWVPSTYLEPVIKRQSQSTSASSSSIASSEEPSPVASLDSVGGGKISHYAVPGRHHHMSKKHKVSGYLSSPGEETTV